jgi:DNA-binding GntR family transcriptional regulator
VAISLDKYCYLEKLFGTFLPACKEAQSMSLIKPADGRPRYLQVCDALVAMIRSGPVAIGDMLPTELELCERFDISRHTAREALRRVEAMGLVERRRGSGTRVKAKFAPVVYTHSVDSLEGLLQYGKASRLVIQQSAMSMFPEALVNDFDVVRGQEIPHLTGIRYQPDQDPPLALCFVELWAPAATGPQRAQLLDLEGCERALHELLDFLHLSRVSQTLSADAIEPTMAKLLGTQPGSPALVVIRRYYDLAERLVLLTLSTHPKNRFRYTTELTACFMNNAG